MKTEVLKKLIENSQSNLINTGKQGQRGCHEQYRETKWIIDGKMIVFF